MSKNLIHNLDGTWNLYSTKESMKIMVEYETCHKYDYKIFFNTMFFKSRKEAQECFSFLDRFFASSEDSYKFTLIGKRIKINLVPRLFIRYTDELDNNPNYVRDAFNEEPIDYDNLISLDGEEDLDRFLDETDE